MSRSPLGRVETMRRLGPVRADRHDTGDPSDACTSRVDDHGYEPYTAVARVRNLGHRGLEGGAPAPSDCGRAAIDIGTSALTWCGVAHPYGANRPCSPSDGALRLPLACAGPFAWEKSTVLLAPNAGAQAVMWRAFGSKLADYHRARRQRAGVPILAACGSESCVARATRATGPGSIPMSIRLC